jgi:hypothetical protein
MKTEVSVHGISQLFFVSKTHVRAMFPCPAITCSMRNRDYIFFTSTSVLSDIVCGRC